MITRESSRPTKCLKCGSSKFEEVVIDYINMQPCEIDYKCECGECINRWSYGAWEIQYDVNDNVIEWRGNKIHNSMKFVLENY